MNPLPMVLAAGAICHAILGNLVWTGIFWAAAFIVAVYHNLQWSKVFKASAVIIAAWAAKKR